MELPKPYPPKEAVCEWLFESESWISNGHWLIRKSSLTAASLKALRRHQHVDKRTEASMNGCFSSVRKSGAPARPIEVWDSTTGPVLTLQAFDDHYVNVDAQYVTFLLRHVPTIKDAIVAKDTQPMAFVGRDHNRRWNYLAALMPLRETYVPKED